MTVHNIRPVFNSKEALDKEKKEISDTLYRVFSKYDTVFPIREQYE